MDCLFTTITVLLSSKIANATSHRDLLAKLRKLRLVTGIQFSCKANKTYALHGSWAQINAAHDLLGHWNIKPSHEPATTNNNESNQNTKLCDCLNVIEILSKLESAKVQSETESRNGQRTGSSKKASSMCINTAAVRKDIEYLKCELLKSSASLDSHNDYKDSQASTESTSKTSCNLRKTSPALKSEECTEVTSHLVRNASLNNQLKSENEEYVLEYVSDSFADKALDSKVLSTINENDGAKEKPEFKSKKQTGSSKPVSKKVKTTPVKSILTSDGVRIHNQKNKPTKESNDKDLHVKSKSRVPLGKKKRRKPGDNGYWSRVKRNDIHLEHMCTLCGVVLKSRKRYCEHKRRIHMKEYKCPVCHKGFGYPSDLNRHKCSPALKTTDEVESKQNSSRKKENTVSLTKQLNCTTCNFVTNSKSRLNIHVKRLHGTSYQCSTCERMFAFFKDLKKHKKSAHSEGYFVCEKCSKMYKSKEYFDLHMKTHEDGYIKPSFMCSSCGKLFTTKYALSVHNKAEHLGMRQMYLCQICGKKFRQRNSYKQHTNAHHGIKPYQCDHCGKAFTYHKSLREHKYMHDSVRRFHCDTCGKTFRQRTTLHIHQKTHKLVKDHTCSVCGKEFTQKQALDRHDRIHSGIKPYKCLVCQKEFGDASTIRRHMVALHYKNEINWRESMLCSLKKKSDYFVLGGSGQNRTYIYKTGKKNQESPKNNEELQSVQSDHNNIQISNTYASFRSSENNHANNMQSSNTHQKVFATLITPQIQIQYPSVQHMPNNVLTASLSIPSNSNQNESSYIAIPSSLILSTSTSETGQNTALQYQGNSFQIPGNLGQIVDFSTVTLLPAKLLYQATPVASSVDTDVAPQPHYLQTDTHGNTSAAMQTATLVPTLSTSVCEDQKPSQAALLADVSVHNSQSVGNLWGVVECSSYYTLAGTVQNTPSTKPQI